MKQEFYGIQVNEDTDIEQLVNEAPVIKLVNILLTEAIEKRASDIHLECFEKELKVRYRIDGVLYEMKALPANLSIAVVSRLKVMASLDIAENRLPQDGRIDFEVNTRRVDLRISTLPTILGENVVMRVLDKSMKALSLEEIGFSKQDRNQIEKIIKYPNGIVLTTGPTGSGKTTTLYSIMKELNKKDVKIITTEDPVEYDINGMIQVQINPKIDLDFVKCLRHILRQDPDIIMVGEIRDIETAQMAVQSALTGHLVLSTLHTNDAASTITRLLDMNIEPFLITATINAVIAQRLVRTICSNCKEKVVPDKKLLAEMNLTAKKTAGKSFYKGKGCNVCGNKGYKGRIGIFEILILDDDIRHLIINNASTAKIRERAEKNGMKLLREDGLRKVFKGITSLEEVVNVTQGYV